MNLLINTAFLHSIFLVWSYMPLPVTAENEFVGQFQPQITLGTRNASLREVVSDQQIFSFLTVD